MDAASVPGTRNARTPLLSDTAARLIHGIDDGDALEELFPLVVEMAKELCNQQLVPCYNCAAIFENKNHKDHMEIQVLFHSFNRKTLRALVMGTIPYDVPEINCPNSENLYPAQGAGAYLASLTIEGREGAFLNCEEIDEVLAILESYRLGCEAWKVLGDTDAYGDSQLDPQQRDHLTFALEVDNTYLPEDRRYTDRDQPWAPLGVTCGRDGVEAIKELEEQLRRRQSFKSSNPQVIQISSPGYIGCSETIASRMPHHDPSSSSMQRSAKIRRVLMSCIRRIGLGVVARSYPILLAWKPSHIRLVEVLATVLAQSLVSVGGLNVIQPGTSSPPKDSSNPRYDDNKLLVFLDRPWYGENMEFSMDMRALKTAFEELEQDGDHEPPPEQEIRKLAESNQQLEAERKRLLDQLNHALYAGEAEMEGQIRRFHETDHLLLAEKLCDSYNHAVDGED
ncbi:hypothetical protein F4805DRAFT_461531 [Annulohypoxylon moriforme]|nr:hypothetical protein F4805DRAFT_461531 [Annulohypoxylon moriforme]